MRTKHIDPEYSYTIEPLTEEDKRKIITRMWFQLKSNLIAISIIILLLTSVIYIVSSSYNLLNYLLIAFFILILILLLVGIITYSRIKTRLKDEFKVIEIGKITKQDARSGDSETVEYTYIGKNTYNSFYFGRDTKVGDKVCIQHTLTKKNKRNLFIQVEKYLE